MSRQNKIRWPNKSITFGATIAVVALMTGFVVTGEAGTNGGTGGDAARGAKLWADNCNRCHNMRDTREFRDDQWRVIVTHMRVRGNLTGEDARDILKFLQSAN